MGYEEEYKRWCQSAYFDAQTKEELKEIAGNQEEVEERFYKNLEFGTGGLRGLLGAGTNRMNRYTVRKATQGLANYIHQRKGSAQGVAIAYDSRHYSVEFAKEAACCLAANGIQVYLFESLRPTPELSFAVRKLQCIAGIVITASHNPAVYNGYKVYGATGAQITAPVDKQIIEEVNKITSYQDVRTISEEEAMQEGRIQMLGIEMDEEYDRAILKEVLSPVVAQKQGKELSIVYTPLHGSGNIPVRRILQKMGFENVYVVAEQEKADGAFPTVPAPNPEDASAYKMALELAHRVQADLILATDPDADRLGVYAWDLESETYQAFTGNMLAAIILEYRLKQSVRKAILTDKSTMVTTIVSGGMGKAIAKEYGVSVVETLTGFKYIGQQMQIFEEEKTQEFIFGYEESYGCLIGTSVRDKDAISAVMAVCEATAYYKEQGKSLCKQMQHLYEQYGYYMESLGTVTLDGKQGNVKVANIMQKIREKIPRKVGTLKVLEARDYAISRVTYFPEEQTQKLTLPKSNVLYFRLEDDAWCCIRPSGTEPKIKCYVGVKENTKEEAIEAVAQLLRIVEGWMV